MSAKLRTPKQKKIWLPLCIALSLCLVAGAVALIVNVFAEETYDFTGDSVTAKELIDADITLLKQKATGEGNESFAIGEKTYTITGTNRDKLYEAVVAGLKKKAVTVTGTLEAQTVSTDTIWNITDDVILNGSITVSSTGRLAIIGTGTLRKNAEYNLSSNGIVIMQDSAFFDGNLLESKMVIVNGSFYLADQARIGNSSGNGVEVNPTGYFYMVGGLIGTKEIIFTWNNEDGTVAETRNYEETLTYIQKREEGYCYISEIESSGGCGTGVAVGNGGSLLFAGGTIAGNTRGIYTDSPNTVMSGGSIFGNRNGNNAGGVMIVKSGFFTMTGGQIWANYSGAYCCGVDVGGEALITGDADISYNSARINGGGIGIEGGATCTIDGNALIDHNTAIGYNSTIIAGSGNGGGIRVTGNLYMNGGTISNNLANGAINDTESTYTNAGNGGGINGQSDGRVATIELNGGTIKNNKSTANGGGVYLTCLQDKLTSTFTMKGTTVQNNISEQDGGGVYLSARSGSLVADIVSGNISANHAKKSGGGLYFELGDVNDAFASAITVNLGTDSTADTGLMIYDNQSQITGGGLCVGRSEKNTDADNIITVNLYHGILKSNQSPNGGGIGVIQGSLNILGGIFDSNTAAKNGGGAYVDNGALTVSGGSFTGNTAQNGGGAHVDDGTIEISGGSIKGNKATDGAGAYLADGILTVSSTGSLTSNTAENNGGGAYVANGKVLMFGGSISQNNAQNGGGLYVSSADAEDAASVIIRSGNIIGNQATTGNGGGIAVVSSINAADQVTIGLCEKHPDLNNHIFTAFNYNETEDNNVSHKHAACPVLKENSAAGSGGGIYMGSTQATINIYCLLESQNTAAGSKNGSGVMATGGKVNIGDDSGESKGNVSIGSSMLVEGGEVTISGNLHNPEFTSTIYVDITDNGGKFTDKRENASDSNLKHYKIQYFENFKGEGTTATGTYSAKQYSVTADIPAEGVLFYHFGWKIIGWNTQEDGKGETISIGSNIGSKDNHTLWGDNPDEPLVLYAVWSRTTYTVKFNPNANNATVTGTMADQKFEYLNKQELTKNAFKIVGKRFVGWNTEADGSGMAYKDGYDQSDLTSSDSVEITLYAQWVDCTHNVGEHPGTVTYTVSENTITETCDCGRTATVTLSAFNVYHDGNPHQATLTYSSNALLAGGVTVTYTKGDAAISGTPTDIGKYTASITVGGVTVSVTCEIKNPADGTTKEGVATPGQNFGEFTGTDSVSISANGAFTVRFSVWKLSTDLYDTAPYLTFSQPLPKDTRIIMVANDSYWYTILGSATEKLELDSFVKMGGSEKYSYNKTASQTYRFLFDFSAASLTSKTDVSFTYDRSTDPITSTVSVSVTDGNYGLTVSGNTVTVTAPSQSDLRWQFPKLILKLKLSDATNQLPGDVSLTVSIGSTNRTYQPNASGEFLVILDWKDTQEVTLTLSSSVIRGVDYDFDVTLAAGIETETEPKTGSIGKSLIDTAEKITLTIAADTSPSLKITGDTTHLVKLETETLTVAIEMRNIPENYRVTATIMCTNCKNTYTALVQDVTVNNGSQTCSFSLSNVNSHGAGSYCLFITISDSNNTTVLQVPYYFIVD